MRQGGIRRALWLGLCAGAVASAEPGVTATTVRVGERSAFSGPSAGLGTELWRGAQAAFLAANDAGGVHGRRVDYLVADDGYDAEQAAPAALKLLKRDVFVLFGGVGTPTILKVLPVVLRQNASDGLFQFANFTGAQPQREPPYDRVVINIRASYRQETRAMVEAFAAMGRKRIGIFVQDDAYGASGRDGVKRALAAYSLVIAADTSYPRGQTYEISTAVQVRILRAAGVDAVVAVGSYQPCAALVRDARGAGWNVPIHNLSFVGADQMLGQLNKEPNAAALVKNLLVTQVVPPISDTSLPLVKDYRAAMDRYDPVAPRGVGDQSYRPAARYSFGSLEGFLNARAFLAVLQKAGPDLTRKGFWAAAESMGQFDLGVGAPAVLSPIRHQALDKVWFTYATTGGWLGIENPAGAIQ
ncbi:MAG TPA: ABC transporter substrate-binding protein [Myxococcaceae bacterium]|jgi:ABC-type branched-subunit amino acid transport system substrate-binding protein